MCCIVHILSLFVGCVFQFFNGTPPRRCPLSRPETERLGRRRAAKTLNGSADGPPSTTTHAAGQGTWEIGSLGIQEDPHQQEQKRRKSTRRGHEGRIAAPQLQQKVRAIAPRPRPICRRRSWIRAPWLRLYPDPPRVCRGGARRLDRDNREKVVGVGVLNFRLRAHTFFGRVSLSPLSFALFLSLSSLYNASLQQCVLRYNP